MPVNQNISKRTIIHWAVYAGYNIALVAWVLDYYKTPYDLGYLYIVEVSVACLFGFLLLLTVVPRRPVWLLWSVLCGAIFSGALYLMFWLTLFGPFLALKLGEHSSKSLPPSLWHPAEIFDKALRPGTVWVLPLMLGGAGFLFMRHHIKKLKHWTEKIDPVAVLGHVAQRMSTLFWVYGASIIFCMVLKNEIGIVYAVLAVKLVWDIWENSRWFDPHNVLGIKEWPWRF